MKKNAHTPIDILELSYVIERDSKSGALSRSLLKNGHKLYEPYPAIPHGLRRHLPSGKVDTGQFRDGVFVVTEINPERESDR